MGSASVPLAMVVKGRRRASATSVAISTRLSPMLSLVRRSLFVRAASPRYGVKVTANLVVITPFGGPPSRVGTLEIASGPTVAGNGVAADLGSTPLQVMHCKKRRKEKIG